MRKPESLSEIFGKLSFLKHGNMTRFRVREIDTLDDYCVYYKDGLMVETWFKALQLDSFCKEIRLQGHWTRYALLSTLEEVNCFSSSHYSSVWQVMYDSYHEFSTAKSEVTMIGEG